MEKYALYVKKGIFGVSNNYNVWLAHMVKYMIKTLVIASIVQMDTYLI